MLRSPEIGSRFMNMLHFFNAEANSLDPIHRRVTVLMLARLREAHYAWWAHSRFARKQGIPEATIQAINRGEKPKDLSPDLSAVFDFVAESMRPAGASDAALSQLRSHLSDRQIVELTLLCGTYNTVAMLLQLGGIEQPEGEEHGMVKLSAPPFSS